MKIKKILSTVIPLSIKNIDTDQIIPAEFLKTIDKKSKYLILLGLSLGILIQLHYVTLMMIPIIISCLALVKFKLK